MVGNRDGGREKRRGSETGWASGEYCLRYAVFEHFVEDVAGDKSSIEDT